MLLALAVTSAMAGCAAVEVRSQGKPTPEVVVAYETAATGVPSATPARPGLANATRVADLPATATAPSFTATATTVARPATNTPTAVPPTPTATRPVLPTATSASAIPTDPVFARAERVFTRGLMGEVRHNSLGPAVSQSDVTKVAEQPFGPFSAPGICHSRDSLMLWREDTRQIFFLLVENGGLHWDECPDYWQTFPDTWQPGHGNNEDIVPPAGKVVPVAGFGKVWREQFYEKPGYGIGFPSAPERYLMAKVQRFEHGTALYFPDTGAVYVLFDEFRYLTRGGETTGRLWFRLD